MFNNRTKSRNSLTRGQPAQRIIAPQSTRAPASGWVASTAAHPFTRSEENARLYTYEQSVKGAFDNIETVLRRISALQHEADFSERAQLIAKSELGFELPAVFLADSWIKSLDMGSLYAWCVFETVQRMSDDFYSNKPLSDNDERQFQGFLEGCGFHTLDVSPCADGRLAHVIRYVMRLPYKVVRRKSYAGAMFDVEDSLQKWIETEMLRHREGKPNAADKATRYLKAAVYHYSSSLPHCEGCAAHGSNAQKAAAGALDRLKDFRKSVENSFCCGASIDLLLIGIDTDNDVIRVHVPDAEGQIDIGYYVDAAALYDETRTMAGADAQETIRQYIVDKLLVRGSSVPSGGMLKFVATLLQGNISQIDYVRQYHAGIYRDIGHQERFIGMGIGFEEIQLRNLTYFAYMQTVEEGAKDIDVGIKIFTGLNANRGLPVPVVIRYDYHGQVPGARGRAIARCQQLDSALRARFSDYVARGLLHSMQMVRDCQNDGKPEVVGSSLNVTKQEAH